MAPQKKFGENCSQLPKISENSKKIKKSYENEDKLQEKNKYQAKIFVFLQEQPLNYKQLTNYLKEENLPEKSIRTIQRYVKVVQKALEDFKTVEDFEQSLNKTCKKTNSTFNEEQKSFIREKLRQNGTQLKKKELVELINKIMEENPEEFQGIKHKLTNKTSILDEFLEYYKRNRVNNNKIKQQPSLRSNQSETTDMDYTELSHSLNSSSQNSTKIILPQQEQVHHEQQQQNNNQINNDSLEIQSNIMEEESYQQESSFIKLSQVPQIVQQFQEPMNCAQEIQNNCFSQEPSLGDDDSNYQQLFNGENQQESQYQQQEIQEIEFNKIQQNEDEGEFNNYIPNYSMGCSQYY